MIFHCEKCQQNCLNNHHCVDQLSAFLSSSENQVFGLDSSKMRMKFWLYSKSARILLLISIGFRRVLFCSAYTWCWFVPSVSSYFWKLLYLWSWHADNTACREPAERLWLEKNFLKPVLIPRFDSGLDLMLIYVIHSILHVLKGSL